MDVATDGDAGFEAALANDFDVAIVDLMLPKRDGLSIIDELRRRQRHDAVIAPPETAKSSVVTESATIGSFVVNVKTRSAAFVGST